MQTRQWQLQKKPSSATPPQTESMFPERPRRSAIQNPSVQRQADESPEWQARRERYIRNSPDFSKMPMEAPERSPVQAKLTVGAPNDVYEQEADRVADQVMSMPDSATQSPVQRNADPEQDELQTKPIAAEITPLVQREEMPEEKEELNMKPLGNSIQREEMSEEKEELQPKAIDNLQREEMPEEKEVQTKAIGSIQREEMPEEEEELNMKPLGNSIQREEMSEEKEELQPKAIDSIQREEMLEEEVRTKPALLQRSPDGNLQAGEGIESRLNQSKGGGSPLSDEVRSFMEPRFGADFSQVRVHTGGEAVQMNQDLNAQAFAHKQDLYFGAGKTPAKDALTAHELTHVVQQTGNSKTNYSPKVNTFVSSNGLLPKIEGVSVLQCEPTGPAKDIPDDPGASLERGTFQYSPDRPSFVVRAGGPGRYADHFFKSSAEASSYALSLASKGEEYIREVSALPTVFANGQPGNPVDYIRVFEVPPATPYIQSVVGPQTDGKSGKEYKGGGPQVIFPHVQLKEVLAVQVAARGRGTTGTPDLTPITVGESSASGRAKGAVAETLIVTGLQALNNISDGIQIGKARTEFFQKLPQIIETLQSFPKQGAKVVIVFLQPVSPGGETIQGPLQYSGLHWQTALKEDAPVKEGAYSLPNYSVKKVNIWIPPTKGVSKSKKDNDVVQQQIEIHSMDDFIVNAYQSDKLDSHLQAFLSLKQAKSQLSATYDVSVNGKILRVSTPLYDQLTAAVATILHERLIALADKLKQRIELGEKELKNCLDEGYFKKLFNAGRDFNLDPHMFDSSKAHEVSARISVRDRRFNDAAESLKKGNLNVDVNQSTLFRYSRGHNALDAPGID